MSTSEDAGGVDPAQIEVRFVPEVAPPARGITRQHTTLAAMILMGFVVFPCIAGLALGSRPALAPEPDLHPVEPPAFRADVIVGVVPNEVQP